MRPHHLRLEPGQDIQQAFNRLFDVKSPPIGAKAPNVRLFDPVNDRMVPLSDLLREAPLLIVFGSYSCPIFRARLDEVEALAKTYEDRLQVVIIYTLEAHPSDENPYVRGVWLSRVNEYHNVRISQHRSMAERITVARNPPRELATRVRLLVDPVEAPETIDELADITDSNPKNNPAWKAYGLLPNSAFLLGVDGRVAFRMAWFRAGPGLLAAVWNMTEDSRQGQTRICHLDPRRAAAPASPSCSP